MSNIFWACQNSVSISNSIFISNFHFQRLSLKYFAFGHNILCFVFCLRAPNFWPILVYWPGQLSTLIECSHWPISRYLAKNSLALAFPALAADTGCCSLYYFLIFIFLSWFLVLFPVWQNVFMATLMCCLSIGTFCKFVWTLANNYRKILCVCEMLEKLFEIFIKAVQSSVSLGKQIL